MPNENGIVTPGPVGAPKKESVSPYMYRVVKLKFEDDPDNTEAFMPQRGIITDTNEDWWFNCVPAPAPTLELAKIWTATIADTDRRCAKGDVVWAPSLND